MVFTILYKHSKQRQISPQFELVSEIGSHAVGIASNRELVGRGESVLEFRTNRSSRSGISCLITDSQWLRFENCG